MAIPKKRHKYVRKTQNASHPDGPFTQMCVRLWALLSLLGKKPPSFTGWRQLGSYISQSDIFGVFEMGSWDKQSTKNQNIALLQEALSRVEQDHERAANAELASRPPPNESALELRVRSVLLQLEIPAVGANFRSVQSIAEWLVGHELMLDVPVLWEKCGRQKGAQHVEAQKGYWKNYAALKAALACLEGTLAARRIIEREGVHGMLEHAGIEVPDQGEKESMSVYTMRLLRQATSYFEQNQLVVEQGATLTTILPVLSNFVQQTHFTAASDSLVEVFKSLPCGACDKLDGIQYRISPEQRVSIQTARRVSKRSQLSSFVTYDERGDMPGCHVCEMETFNSGFPTNMLKAHHAWMFRIKRDDGPRWNREEVPIYVAGDLVCPLCSLNPKDDVTWRKWSVSNGMKLMTEASYPVELRNFQDENLTPRAMEISLLGQYAPFLRIVRLPGEGVKSVGNSIVLEQDFEHIVNSLPRYPSQCPYILVSRYSEDDSRHASVFGVKRERVARSVDCILRINEKYADYERNDQALACLPEEDGYFHQALEMETELRGSLLNTSHIRVGGEVHVSQEQEVWNGEGSGGMEEARHYFKQLSNDTETFLDNTGDLGPVGREGGLDEASFEELRQVGELGDVVAEQGQEEMTAEVLARITKTNVNEILRVPLRKAVKENVSALFARCYPTIFPFGLGDITDEDLGSIVGRIVPFAILQDFWTFARRLLWSPAQALVRHPVAPFHMVNFMHRKMLGEASAYYVREKLSDPLQSAEALLARAKEGELQGFFETVHAVTGKVHGSDAFFNEKHRDLQGMVLNLGLENNWPAAFMTLTLAENHHSGLWRVLAERHGIIASENEEENVEARKKLARENPHVVSEFFHSRFHGLMETVLKKAWGVSDYAVRFEFAEQRGAVHAHIIIWRTDGMPHGILRTEGLAGLQRFYDELGFSCQHPGAVHERMFPEGTMTEPYDKFVLKSMGLGDLDSHEVNCDYINILGIHKCSAFCLRGRRRFCRSGYGDSLVAKPDAKGGGLWGGKLPHANFELRVRPDGRLEAEGPRNHPRTLNVPLDLLRAWKASLDVSIILIPGNTSDPRFIDAVGASVNYLNKYTCKSAKSAIAAAKVYTDCLETTVAAEPETLTRNAVKKMMFKTISERHVPLQEAVWDLCRLPLFETTMMFKRVSLGASRKVKKSKNRSAHEVLEDDSDLLTRDQSSDNVRDVYDKLCALPRENENGEKARGMSLYSFTARGGRINTMDNDETFVPVFTGVGPIRPTTMSAAPRLANIILTMAKPAYRWPGAMWCHQEGGPGQAQIDELVEFSNNPACPPLFRAWANWCKTPYDVRSSMDFINVHMDAASVGSGEEKQAPGFECWDFRTDPNDFDDCCGDAYGDPARFSTGQEFDLDRFSSRDEESAMDFLDQIVGEVLSQTRKLPHFVDADWVEMGSSPNEEQSLVLRIVLDGVLRNIQHVSDCSRQVSSSFPPLPEKNWVRLLVAGGPGTGKSWLLQVMTDLVQVTTASCGSTGVSAPTGSAASIINGDTLHSFFDIPVFDSGDVENIFDTDISTEKLRVLENRCKDLVVLIIDERSMLSPELLGYVDLRCRQARRHLGPEFGEASFGAIPIVLMSGDDGQLDPVRAPSLHAAMSVQNAKKAGGDSLNHGSRAELIRIGVFRYVNDFRDCIYLKQSVRHEQRPCSVCKTHLPGAACSAFPDLLRRLRFGELEQKDFDLLFQRELSKLEPEEALEFEKDNTLRVVSTNVAVHEATVNGLVERQERLQRTDFENSWGAVLQSKAGRSFPKLNGRDQHDVEGGIPAKSWYLKNQPCVITANILPRCGLYNGTFAIMEDAVFSAGERPDEKGVVSPKYIVLRVPGHTLPRPWKQEDPELIPVPVRRAVGASSRVGFPFKACAAVTAYKAQGFTVGKNRVWERLIGDLGPCSVEQWAGGTGLVIVSRPEDLSRLAFAGRLSVERLREMFTNRHMSRVRDADMRLKGFDVSTQARINATIPSLQDLLIHARSATAIGAVNVSDCCNSFLSLERLRKAAICSEQMEVDRSPFSHPPPPASHSLPPSSLSPPCDSPPERTSSLQKSDRLLESESGAPELPLKRLFPAPFRSKDPVEPPTSRRRILVSSEDNCETVPHIHLPPTLQTGPVTMRMDLVLKALGSGAEADVAFEHLVREVKHEFEAEQDLSVGQHMLARAFKRGFKIQNVNGDGSCLFHSICRNLGGVWIQRGHDLRRLLERVYRRLEEMQTRVRASNLTFPQWVAAREAQGTTYLETVANLRNSRIPTGTTEQEVLARMFRCEILVFERDPRRDDLYVCRFHYGESRAPTVRILYTPGHFQTLFLAGTRLECDWFEDDTVGQHEEPSAVYKREALVWEASGEGSNADVSFNRIICEIKEYFESWERKSSGSEVGSVLTRDKVRFIEVKDEAMSFFTNFCANFEGDWEGMPSRLQIFLGRVYEALEQIGTRVYDSSDSEPSDLSFFDWVGKEEDVPFFYHLIRLQEGGSQGITEREVLAAMFKCELLCYSSVQDAQDIFVCEAHLGENNLPTIRLLRRGSHFYAFTLLSSDEDCT